MMGIRRELLLKLCLWLAPLSIQAQGPTPSEYRFRLAKPQVIDGDTIKGDLQLPLGVTLRDQRVRFLGVDTWELRGEHKPRGLEAKCYTQAAIQSGEVYLVPSGNRQRDNFGRVLAWVYVRDGKGCWRNLATELIEREHGIPVKDKE